MPKKKTVTKKTRTRRAPAKKKSTGKTKKRTRARHDYATSVEVETRDLQHVLALAKLVADHKSEKIAPFLSSCLMRVDPVQKMLVVSITNLTTTMRAEVPCVSARGCDGWVIQEEKLRLIQEITGDVVTLSYDRDVPAREQIEIRSGSTEAHLTPFSHPRDYPVIAHPRDEECEVEPDEDAAPVLRAVCAASYVAGRGHLRVVHVEHDEDQTICITTDGVRLAKYSVDCVVPGLSMGETVSLDSIKTFKSILSTTTRVGICIESEKNKGRGYLHVTASVGEMRVSVSSRLCASKFPPWRTVVPSTRATITVQRSEFTQMLASVCVLNGDSLMMRNWDDEKVQVSSEKADHGDVKYVMDTIKGPRGKWLMRVKPRYLEDAIKNIVEDEICLDVDPDEPLSSVMLFGAHNPDAACAVIGMMRS